MSHYTDFILASWEEGAEQAGGSGIEGHPLWYSLGGVSLSQEIKINAR